MADESFFLGFTTDVNDVVGQIAAAMPRLERVLQEAGGTLDGLDLGGALLRNFQADLAKMGEAAATQTARIRGEVERALTSTSTTKPFQLPTGGAYNTQANQVNTGLLSNVRQLASAYTDSLPAELRQQLLPAIEAEARRYAQERLAVQRQINEADVASLKAVAAELRAGGLDVAARAAITGGGNQAAAIGRRVETLFPAAPPVGTDSERAENEHLARLRAATQSRAREAEIGTNSERVENEYLTSLRAARQTRASQAALGTDSERAENEYLASVRALSLARARQAEIGTESERVENEYLAGLRAASRAHVREAELGTSAEGLENLYLAALRAATRTRGREAELGTATERAENEYLAALRGRTQAAGGGGGRIPPPGRATGAAGEEPGGPSPAEVSASMRRLASLGTSSEQAENQHLAELRAASSARRAKEQAENERLVTGIRTKVAAEAPNPDDVELARRKFTVGQAQEQATRLYQADAQRMGLAQVRATRLDAELAQAEQERINATRVAAEYTAGTARRGGGYYQVGSGDIFKETTNGAQLVESDLELIRARKALATALKAEQAATLRENPQGFFKSFGSAFTSRSAYGGTSSQGFDLGRVPSNVGARLGSVAESFAGFALLGGVLKAVSDTKKETLDYIDSLTNLEVRMQATGSVTASFTNQLEGLSRLAGSNVGAELDAAARSVAAFGDKTKDTTADLRTIGAEGATAASQLSVITGTDLKSSADNMIAVASSFGIAGDSLSQVNDAIANAKQLGGNANDIASGLAGIAGAAQEAGFNMQQAADVISLVTARTNESGTAAATRITALFSLLGSHQTTLQGLGVDTTASTKDQIDQLAAAFPKLSQQQQKATLSALGGRTALRELIPLLTENKTLQAAYAASLDHSGAGTDEFNRKNNDLAGLFRKIGGDITNIQINLERSGIFDAIGLSLKLLEPGLRTLSDILGLVDRFVDTLDNLHLGPLGEIPGTLLDIWLALKLIDSIRPLSGILTRIPGIGGTRALPAVITTRAPGLAQPGAEAAGAGAAAGATAATEANTAAVGANTAAKATNAKETAETAAAEGKAVKSREAEQAAILAEIRALAELSDVQAASMQLELRSAEAREFAAKAAYDEITALSQVAEFEGLLARVEAEGLGPLTALIDAEKLRADALNASILLEGRQIEQLELLAAAEGRAAAAAAVNNAEQGAAGAAGARTGMLGRLGGFFGRGRGAAAAGEAGAAEGAGAGAAGGAGLLGPIGIGIAVFALVVDPLFHAIRDAAAKTKKSLDDTAGAIGDVGNAANPEDMHKAADALRTAAAERAASTSGKVGATLGFFEKYTGGRDSNADAKELRDAATREDARAKALDEAEKKAASNGSGAVFGGAANTIDGIKAGFDKMAAAGESAEHQIDALVEALGGLDGKGTGPGTLLPGQGPELGQLLASRVQGNQEISLVDLLNQGGGDGTSNRAIAKALVEGGKYGPGKLGGLDPQKQQDTQDAVTKTVTDYLDQHGLSNGGRLTDAQQKELADKIADIEIKALGLTGKDFDSAKATASAKVLAQLRSGTNPGDLIVSQETADFVANNLVQKASTAAQDTKIATGSDVAAARVRLAKIQQAEALVISKGQKVNDDTRTAELAAEQDLADALSAQADAYESMAKDELGKDDAIGRAQDDVATAARHYAEAVKSKDPNKINKAKQEKIDADRALQAQQQGLYQSYLAGQENPNDRTQTDTKQLQIERNKLAHTDQYGANGKLTKAYRDQLKVVKDLRDKVLADQVDDANAIATDSVDSRDTVGNAEKQLSAAQANLASLQARGAGKREIDDAKKKVADAGVALTQARITDSNTNRDAAVAAGDTVGQAYAAYLDLVATEAGEIGSALAATKRQATEAYAKFLKVKADADHTKRLAKINPEDKLAVNAEDLRYDDVVLAIKGQSTEDIAAERAKKVSDLVTRAQLRVALANAKGSAAVRQGDPLSAAAAALAEARRNLSLDTVKNDKYYNDLAALHQQEYAYAQAADEHAKVLLELASDTTDPVAQARVALAAATRKLKDDQRNRTGDLAQDQLDKETAAQALQKSQFDQNLQNQQNAYQLHEESADQYLTFLKSQDSSIRKQLAGMKKGQEGYQQMVDELNTIDQAIQGLNSQLEGQFNLGSIKLPTVYEVRRSEANGATAASSSVANAVTNNTITINGADMQTVINYLSSVLGKSSMTVATTGRKAAA